MEISKFLTPSRVIINLKANTKEDAIKELASSLQDNVTDLGSFVNDVFAREAQASTGIGDNIGMPHAKSKYVKFPAVVLATKPEGLEFDSIDEEPVNLLVMLAVPENSSNEHLKLIAQISKLLLKPGLKDALLEASTPEEVLEVIAAAEGATNQANAFAAGANGSSVAIDAAPARKKIVAVTACPTGIAHTYMAQEALEAAARELGVDIKVETNGASGVSNKLTEQEITEADGIILAINRSINMTPFVGKRALQVGAQEAIKNAKSLINAALSGAGNVVGNVAAEASESTAFEGFMIEKKSFLGLLYKHLMGGVSFMLPFVISGGILIALSFIIDRLSGVPAGPALGSTTHTAQLFMSIGKQAFALFVPILGAYIAYSIADRAALTAGLVAGALAFSGGCGFLGAIVGGFIAGYVTVMLMKLFAKTPRGLEGVKNILAIPVLSVLLTGLLMLLIFATPIKYANEHLVHWLQSMSGSNRLILSTLLAGMMAIDMGGPFNKAAYVFAVTSLAAGPSASMAAVMGGGMVPPLAIALATTFFKSKFTAEQREAGKVNYVMGLSFITEGAIPFVASDPLRMIPICMIGSALCGLLCGIFDVTLQAPHGGIVVMFLSNHFFYYLFSILVGSAVSALLIGILKKKVSTAKC